jgi:hypothetical protein
MSVRNRILMAAVICACAASGRVGAADVPNVSVYSNSPAALSAGPCVSQNGCASGAGGVSRYTAGVRGVPACTGSSCESRFQKLNKKEPYAVNLCPGACFGYFQTQWRSWDEVCPTQGTIVDMKPPAPYLPPASDRPPQEMKKNGENVPPPRPVDPKMGMGRPLPPPTVVPSFPATTALPQIPPYPGANGR